MTDARSRRTRPPRSALVRQWVVPALILGAGIAVAVAVATVGGAPASDTFGLVATALGGAAVVVAIAVALGASRRTTSVGVQAAAVALASVSATIVGVLAGARAMFISSHDLTALGVIVATATGAGLTVAWRLGTRVDDDVRRLTGLSERLADGEHAEVPPMRTAEFGHLGTDLVSMADRLAEAHERELALERSRRELVAWISHDLRSPLAGIRAMAEAIEDGVVDDRDEVERYLRSIGEETERLAALVDDLFELSRVSSGLVEFRCSRVGVGELLRASLQGVAPIAEADGVELRLPPDALTDSLDDLHVSQPETVRVLRNLLDNAIRHTPAGGVVAIEVSASPSALDVSVIDQCGGIPVPDLERVFDVAFRGDNARGRDGGGGLGLAVARELAEAQDGSIVVSNHAGGCCFSVRLPTWSPTDTNGTGTP